jgi:hypothetical protein
MKPKKDKNEDPFAKQRAKQDSKLSLQATKPAEKSFAGTDLPNKMYLPKKQPMPSKPAPAPAKKASYTPPKSKQVFGTVKAQQNKQRGMSKCYKGGK